MAEALMNEEILNNLGLSKNETKVYLTLIELGLSTGSVIADKTKIHRTNVYDALERLIEKGLASYIIKDKVKYFQATDPENLMNVIKEKEESLKKILPTLIMNRQFSNMTEVSILEGVVAARNVLLNLLKNRQPIFIYGVPKEAKDILGSFHLEKFHKERIALNIPEKVIYNEDAVSRIKELNKIPLCEVRTLPKEFNSPFSTNICGDEVFFGLFSREPCLTIHIKSKEIADTYKKYFEVLWRKAKICKF